MMGSEDEYESERESILDTKDMPAPPTPSSTPLSELEVEEETLVVKSRWRTLITVEPIFVLFSVAMGIFGPAESLLAYQKVCHMVYNDTHICSNLHNSSFKAEEDVVQSHTSIWFLYMKIGFDGPALLMAIVYGSISDHFSRRLALVLPSVGQILSLLVFLLNVIYIDAHVAFLLIGSIISGFSGSWICLVLAGFSFLSEVSTPRNRTFRIGVGEITLALSWGLAYFLSGVILDNTNYIFVTVFSLLLLLLTMVYTFVWIQEPQNSIKESMSLCSVLSVRQCGSSVISVFRKRKNNGRARLVVLLAAVFFASVSVRVFASVGFLYLKRQPLSWSQSLFGYYVGTSALIRGICLLLFLPLMTHVFKFTDTTIIILGIISTSAEELLFGLSTKTWMVFIVPLVGFLSDGKMTAMRSLLSNLVDQDELGKMFAIVGALQGISGLLGAFVYNNIYPLTLTFWPGFCFLLSTVISIIPISLTVWLHKDLKRAQPYKRIPPRLDADKAPLMSESEEEEMWAKGRNGDMSSLTNLYLEDLEGQTDSEIVNDNSSSVGPHSLSETTSLSPTEI